MIDPLFFNAILALPVLATLLFMIVKLFSRFRL